MSTPENEGHFEVLSPQNDCWCEWNPSGSCGNFVDLPPVLDNLPVQAAAGRDKDLLTNYVCSTGGVGLNVEYIQQNASVLSPLHIEV